MYNDFSVNLGLWVGFLPKFRAWGFGLRVRALFVFLFLHKALFASNRGFEGAVGVFTDHGLETLDPKP